MYGMYSEDCEGCGCLAGMDFGGPLWSVTCGTPLKMALITFSTSKNYQDRNPSVVHLTSTFHDEEQSNSCCFVWPLQ